jgi:hypothetical protein
MGAAVLGALRDPSFALIFLGFFSCGYQLAFITAHFPAFVAEACGPILPGGVLHSMGITTTSALGAVAISIIGLGNIAGTLAAGWAGQAVHQEVPPRGHLHGADDRGGVVHPDADDARDGAGVLGGDGVAVARHGAADLGARRAPLRAALHGARSMASCS